MSRDHFVHTPGVWIGEGKLKLSAIPEELRFITTWNVAAADSEGNIACTQEVRIDGLTLSTINKFSFRNQHGSHFLLDLETEALGKVGGKGFSNGDLLAWELSVHDIGFAGFEVYEKVTSDSYKMRGEFATGDQFRSEVTGHIQLQKRDRT